MKAIRCLASAGALLLPLLLSGCFVLSTTRKLPVPTAPAVVQTVTPDELVARVNQARAEGVDVEADTYAYTAWFNTFSAFVPPWAHDGGDKKLIERLKDPATRPRIRKEMETPSREWDNEWQQVPGPEGFLVGAVQNPKLLPLQGKNL